MDHGIKWVVNSSYLDEVAERIRSAFMTVSESSAAIDAVDAIVKACTDIDISFLDQDERPKYDPYNVRSLWKRPCPQQKYRAKRPLQMVHYNQVPRMSKPKHGRGRRH